MCEHRHHADREVPVAGPAPAREQLTIAPDAANDTWTGDLDGMIDRKTIRVLTTYSKTFYFLDKATQRGVVYDAFRLFEDDLNKRLSKQHKLKQRHVKVRVVFIPVARDELLPALAAGRGDIAAANLTITPDRLEQVDFTSAIANNVSELVVSGPRSPAISAVEDLSGKEVYVRRSASYHESLVALNQRLASRGKPAVVLRDVPETLEDEDLLEMVNAGLIPLVVVDKHKVDFWKQVFPTITVHEGAALRTGGATAWAIRKGSPQLKADLDAFIARNGVGTATGNTIALRYFKSAKYVKDAASEAERRKFLVGLGNLT